MSDFKINTLILCTSNAARSQMAEAYLRKFAGDLMHVYSAGTEPMPMHPLAIQVMNEAGLDIGKQRSKHFSEFLGTTPFYYLIVFCSDAENRCASVWPGALQRDFWLFEDPAETKGSEEEQFAAFRRVRNLIEAKTKDWAEQIRKSKQLILETAESQQQDQAQR